jgi:hypothetical protein
MTIRCSTSIRIATPTLPLSELVGIALAERLNEITGGDFRPGKKGTAEPDVVCVFSEWYNIEIKVSSTQYEVPGHAYNKNTKTKNLDAYYLVTNYLLKDEIWLVAQVRLAAQ